MVLRPCVSPRAFGRISYFLREGSSESRAVRTGNLDIIPPSCMAVFMAARRFDGVFRPFWPFFALLRVLPELSAIFRSPRWRRVLCHRGLLHNFILRACRHMASFLNDRVQNNNNNNNTIWGGSVLTGEEPPLHSGDLNHALSQAGGPTYSQLSRPMSSGHHISMEHRLRRKQLNSDTNASKKIF